MFRRRRPDPVYGYELPTPVLTQTGFWLAAAVFGAPLLAALLLFDLLVWAIGEAAFGACLAVWCVF